MRHFMIVSCMFLLLGAFPGLALSQDMSPLRQAFSEENSASRKVYAAERCAGLFSAIYARMTGTGRSDVEQLAVKNLMLASEATMLAIEIGSNAGMTIDDASVMRVALRISEQYTRRMDKSYDNTGNSFDDFILDDQDFCVLFIQQGGTNAANAGEITGADDPIPSDILIAKETIKEEMNSSEEVCHLERVSSLKTGGGLHEQIILVVGKTKAEGFGILFSVELILDSTGAKASFQSVEGNWRTDPSKWEVVNGMKVASGKDAIGFLISVFESDGEMMDVLINNNPIIWDNVAMVRFDKRGNRMRHQVSFGPKLTEFRECFNAKEPRIRAMLTG